MNSEIRRQRSGGARLAEPEPPRAGAYSAPRAPSCGEEPPRRRPGPRRRKRRGRGWLVLCAVPAVLVGLFVCYRLWAKAPEVPGGEDAPQTSAEGRKEGFYTFLIVGRDTGGGGNTDTIMLASYDTVNQQAALMSIPRDTMVDVSWDVKKINTVYNRNLSGGEEAAVAALKGAVAGLVGFRPDYTVLLEWEAVGELVEAIGGVYFDVPFYMHYVDPTQDLYIEQEAGYRLLSGDDAMQVVRWRKNNGGVPNPEGTDGSDLGRARIQQDFIAAVLRQCLQLKNLVRLKEFASVFARRVETELTVGNLVWFAEKAVLGGFSTEDLYVCTMPNTLANIYSASYQTKLSYVLPKGDELLEVVNGHFDPWLTEVGWENLDLMRLNGDGSVSPTSGTAKGRKGSGRP